MTEAQRWLERVTLTGADDVITRSVDHARALYLAEHTSPELAAQFGRAADDLARHGTMTADAQRGWANLTKRLVDTEVSARLDRIAEKLVIGATSGGEVSTMTRGFADGSHAIVVDHGLANLTWLAAGLHVLSRRTPMVDHPPATDPIDPEVAARTLRLAVAWIAGGGRAGVGPSLVLESTDLMLAGALVNEMDVFVMAHEAAHILLGHGNSGYRGAEGRDEESAADLLGVVLLFDDLLTAGKAPAVVADLRITALRLFFAVVDLYERSCFLLRPASHPPALERWRTLVNQRLAIWFDDLDEMADVPLAEALADLKPDSRLTDPSKVHNGLGRRLDTALWSYRDWSMASVLGHRLCAPAGPAVAELRGWPGWDAEADVAEEITALVTRVLRSDEVREMITSAVTSSHAISRLTAAQTITPVVDMLAAARNNADPFPIGAAVTIVMNALNDQTVPPA